MSERKKKPEESFPEFNTPELPTDAIRRAETHAQDVAQESEARGENDPVNSLFKVVQSQRNARKLKSLEKRAARANGAVEEPAFGQKETFYLVVILLTFGLFYGVFTAFRQAARSFIADAPKDQPAETAPQRKSEAPARTTPPIQKSTRVDPVNAPAKIPTALSNSQSNSQHARPTSPTRTLPIRDASNDAHEDRANDRNDPSDAELEARNDSRNDPRDALDPRDPPREPAERKKAIQSRTRAPKQSTSPNDAFDENARREAEARAVGADEGVVVERQPRSLSHDEDSSFAPRDDSVRDVSAPEEN